MENNIHSLPTVAMRGLVVFPYMQLNFDVARTASVKAIETASQQNSKIFLVTQRKAEVENPKEDDIYRVGTIAVIKQIMHLPGNVTRLIVKGISRGIIREYESTSPHFVCRVEEINEAPISVTDAEEAYCRVLKNKLEEYFAVNPKLQADKFMSILDIKHLGQLCDTIAAMTELDTEDKQVLLNELNYERRAEELIDRIEHLIDIMELENKIIRKTHERINENQHEYFLREQLHVIEDELGDKDGIGAEVEEFRKKIEKLKIKKEHKDKLLKDVERFSKIPSVSADSGVIRTYLEAVLGLPWDKAKKEKFDIKAVEKVLDEDHYGLEKVKERILEFLAVRSLTKGKNTTVLCLEGPPGVGKTSVAKSIARALGRKYVRVSLGGIHDEADIRGHRKTYIGAMEGRIIAAMREAGVKNPVMLLDEVDKMGIDYKGDPSAALLEVLDNEQNNEFRDHYIEIPYDLSDVLFITTANTLETISQPLLDRMEIINLSGYTAKEKFYIARDYLVKKALVKTGMSDESFSISDGAINMIIDHYTREAGVRKLEQTIESLLRKAAKEMLDTGCGKVSITKRNITDYLGKEKYHFDLMNETDEIGIARGLAWTSVGGETLSVEANVMEGTGKVELTGKLGDVMKESAMAAISYIRSKSDELDIDADFYKTKDIHIHVPEGAVPKDGPSAGITMATAVVSSLSKTPIRRDVAMTGEITLRGKVLPIGGLKEKSMAAYRAGIKTVIIPDKNKCDIDEIPNEIRGDMKFIPVSNMDEVLDNSLRRE
ncbi:MAG: endopeptidase La [Clostridiales bacterium]|nr:endopeptidase La [Clostridiales bacterium]